jgi:RNA polymerase sigma-70 factor (ECF subfamily)
MALEMADLEAMYRKYGLVLERRCTRILGSPSDGRDAAHEAFARAAAKLATYRAENEKLAWLYRISTNVCFNMLRDRKRRGEAWLKKVADTKPADAQADSRMSAMSLLETVNDELTRALVVHVYLDEMSQGEAADLLGISRATANTRLGTFREQARAALGGEL